MCCKFSGWLLAAAVAAFLGHLSHAQDESSPDSSDAETAKREEVDPPRQEYARSYLKAIRWRQHEDGTFPAAALANLREQIETQLKEKPDWTNAAAAKAWLERTAKIKSFKESELVTLLDEAAVWEVPVVGWAELGERFAEMNSTKTGRKLKKEELVLAWGKPADNGLRVAWVLEPTKPAYAQGEVIKARVVFHNSGKDPVQFVTHTWHQDDRWHVRTAAGAEVEVKTTWYSGITPHQRYILAPGQAIDVPAHGAAIGDGKYEEEFSLGQVGAVIMAKEGDELIATWDMLIPGFEMRDGKGVVSVPGKGDWTGSLTTGEVKFKVTKADPDAGKGLGSASGPGRYKLGERTQLLVSRTTHPDGHYSNTAKIAWLSDDPAKPSPHEPHELNLPDGLGSFAIAWQRGGTELAIAEAGTLRVINFADPAKVTEERQTRDWVSLRVSPAEIDADTQKEMVRLAEELKAVVEKKSTGARKD